MPAVAVEAIRGTGVPFLERFTVKIIFNKPGIDIIMAFITNFFRGILSMRDVLEGIFVFALMAVGTG